MSALILVFFALLISCLVVSIEVLDDHFDFSLSYYPETVPYFPVRSDPWRPHMSLARGHFRHFWGRLPTFEFDKNETKVPHKEKVTFERFQEVMQCSKDEPALNQHGTFSMLKMVKPTREMVELFCGYAESEGDCSDWAKCRKSVNEKFKAKGEYRKEGFPESFRGFQLFRITNGSLYVDWPWGRDRLYDPSKQETISIHPMLIVMVLDMLKPSEIEDSVFFFGAELPGKQPWNHPFPNVAFNPSRLHNMIPWPWYTEFWYSYQFYYKFFEQHPHHKGDISDMWIDETLDNWLWENRIAKGALFANFEHCRQILFDQQRAYPHLVDTSLSLASGELKPWNPLSTEGIIDVEKVNDEEAKISLERDPIGFALPMIAMRQGKGYNPGHYKYVVVPLAMDGTGSSGRLLWLLAFSGATILLQEGMPTYHITSRLVPWVHYVPLSVTGADLAEKVAWLKDHDEMAKQIAENGRNFGKSYLRLEDYFCYAAKALVALGHAFRNSTAIEPFDPVMLSNRRVEGLSVNR